MPTAGESRLLIVKPGDTLVIGHAPALTSQQVAHLKQMLGLAAVIAVPGPIDLAAIRAAGRADAEQPS
ncbi:hypothetical protein [Streptomyces lushanensis]|uniref:hypothetical protein n=1 Tax=Streptomyces lushanensis TaxID=1434255 RepID=UPI00082D78DE|nr:hypothetical protein [Streptomyces lushanensis]